LVNWFLFNKLPHHQLKCMLQLIHKMHTNTPRSVLAFVELNMKDKITTVLQPTSNHEKHQLETCFNTNLHYNIQTFCEP